MSLIPHAVICAAAIFLLLFGDQISARRRNRQAKAADRAWIDDRINTATHPGHRTAWQTIRDTPKEGQ